MNGEQMYFKNKNTGIILTEEQFHALHEEEYRDLSEDWKTEGFGSREEYITWLRENDSDSDFIEVDENGEKIEY